MPDREKVVDHLNDCLEASRRENTWVFARKDIVEDAIALLKECKAQKFFVDEDGKITPLPIAFPNCPLKEQDAKHVNISQTHCGMKYGLCPRCEKQIDTLVNPHYCGNCGQELKWE